MNKEDELKLVNEFIKMNTFVDEQNRCGFVIAHWLRMPGSLLPAEILNMNISDKKMLKRLHIDHDKQMIMLKVNIRFIKSLSKIGANGPKLYLSLRQFFTEDAIKDIFPRIHFMFKDMEARKARATARCVANRARNENEREIYRCTHKMTLREAARSYGCL